MMKKILSVFLTAVLIFGCVSVNAAIPQNDGKGTVLTFGALTKNSPSSGTYFSISTVSDDYFGTVNRYIAKGVVADKSYTTYKSYLAFDIDDTVSVTANDYVFASFYYRVNTTVDSTEYSSPKSFNYHSSMNRKDGGLKGMDISVTDEWHYMQVVSQVYSTLSSTTQIQLYLSAVTNANTDKICIDIADPKAVYMGPVTAVGDDPTQSEQILSQLSSTGISAISIGETSIDLAANPSSYTTTDALSESDIAVTTSYGNADKVIIDKSEISTGTQFTVKVYPPATDYTSESAVPAKTYTIISEKASAQFEENGGYGTGIINDNIVPMYTGTSGRKFNKVTTLEGADAAGEPFDKIYNWERTAFTVEGTSNTSYIAFSAPGGKTAKAGDWVYVSFYYRINPNAPEDSSSKLYTSVRSDSNDNYLGSDESSKAYININSASWIRAEYIQKLANDTVENWVLKLSGPLTKDSGTGTVSGGYLNVDFADIQIIYFGENTGNTDDESIIKETINQKLNTCGLTNVYVNGEEVKSANPSKYETYSPRYSAGVTEKVEITGDTVYGAGTATVVRSKTDESVYYVKSYAPAYDFLNPNASLAESYEVDVKYSYDFYEQDGKLYGVSLEREDMKGVVIAALYSHDGNMTGVVGFKSFTLGSVPSAVIDMPSVTSENYAKVFVFEDVSGISPYIKAMTVTSEGITQ